MFTEFLKSLLRLRKTTVSVLLLLTYFTIALIYLFDHRHYKHILPEQSGFEEAPRLLEDAWLHLQNITYSYHPYFSRDNARVHEYLLDKITGIAQLSSYVSVSDDVEGNRSIISDGLSVPNVILYFESANILAKVQGKDSELPGLLLSAHYDSVPTGHGATDDGKGVVSLLGILDYYSQHQPERTLVFNFNNNEEFGLLGATAFFDHPWSKLVYYMINLEGTGIGGKAVLFRTSDVSTARIYQKAVKVAPFGNSIYQQGFYERRVNSETDYKIYEKNGLRGFDIAFYKPRDLYHTRKDSVQYTTRAALWHMFHTTWQLTDYFAKGPVGNEDDYTPAVYFDVAGLYFFVTSAKSLFKWCCAILITFPIVHFLLDFISTSQQRENNKYNWTVSLRLPLSFSGSILVLLLTEGLLKSNNPFALSRGYMAPLLALGSEFLITNYFFLSFFEYLWPTQDFKTTAYRQVAILTWAILLFFTVMLYKTEYEFTGIYCLAILYPLCSMASIVGYLSRVFRKDEKERLSPDKSGHSGSYGSHGTDEEQQRLNTPQTSENTNTNMESPIEASGNNSTQLDERAPLFGSNQSSTAAQPKVAETLKRTAVRVLNYDWSIQFFICVPIGTFFVFNCVDLALDALNQTIQESATATVSVWNLVVLGAIFLSLPVLPFAYKLNYCTATFFLLVCASTLNWAFLESPFTKDAPLHVRFTQQINVTNSTDAVVNIYGRKGGFLKPMIQDLPSVKQREESIWCRDEADGREICSYVGYAPHLIDSANPVDISDIFSVRVLSNNRNSSDRSSYAPINAELQIDVKENRGCSLWFRNRPSDHLPVRQITIRREDNSTRVAKTASGFTELQLHKWSFDQPSFRVGLQWLPKILLPGVQDDMEDQLDVSVTCYWGEYDSESLVAGEHLRKVPAFDELLQYAPLNFSFSNREKGLLTISEDIKL